MNKRASMRPGLLCPGSRQRHAPVLAMPAASMRPGLLCPGRKRCHIHHHGKSVASMRPGLLCPGRPCGKGGAPYDPKLQ